MKTLLRKELRQLLPIALAIGFIMTINLGYTPLSSRLDEVSWTSVTDNLEPGEGLTSAVLFLVLGLITAFSLFPREHDEGTIEFLYSLPVRRGKIFAAKFLAALTVMVGGIALGLTVDALLPLFNGQTFSGHQFRLDTAIRLFFLFSIYALVNVCHGLFFSFFRRFGILLYAMVWWVIWTLEHGQEPVPWVNHLAIMRLEYFGTRLLIPWDLAAGHLLIASALLGLAFVLWTVPSDTAMTWYENLPKKMWGRILLVLGTLGVVALVFSIAYRLDADHPTAEKPEVYYQTFLPARYQTRHYHFTYPSNFRGTALPLMQRSDEVFQKVRDLLGAGSRPKIVVDLTEESVEHAGIAGWKKIRMNIFRSYVPEAYFSVLYHETAHVFQEVESNQRMSDHANSTHFFHEGLAERVKFLGVPDEDTLALQRLVGAVVWSRLGVKFEEMANLENFRRLYDENLAYAVGELWLHALVQTCGAQAPGDAVRAMGRDDAPGNLEGAVLWQDTLQAIGCGLESVNVRWQQEMSEIAGTPEAARIPRISGGVSTREDRMIILVAQLDRSIPDDYPRFSVRVRKSETDPEDNVREYWGTVREGTDPLEIEFQIPTYLFPGRRFSFQFGYQVAPGIPTYYERWQSGSK